jgi:hypothetical protein
MNVRPRARATLSSGQNLFVNKKKETIIVGEVEGKKKQEEN